MTINTDYAQLQTYGQMSHKVEKNVTKPIEQWPELVKKYSQLPQWHRKRHVKAKL